MWTKLGKRFFGKAADDVPEGASPVDAIVRLLKEESGTSQQVGSTYHLADPPIVAESAPQQAPRGKANGRATSA